MIPITFIRRHARRLAGVARISARISNGGRSWGNRIPIIPLTSILLVSIASVSIALSDSDKAQSSSLPLDAGAVSTELRTRLKGIREKLRKQGRSCPIISFHCENNTQALEIHLDRRSNLLELISIWNQILGYGTTGSSSSSAGAAADEKENNTSGSEFRGSDPTTNTDGALMSFISPSRLSSILVRKIAENHVSVTVYKDGGFTSQDLDFIAEGYEVALSHAPIPGTGSSSSAGQNGNSGDEKSLRKDISSGPFGFHFIDDGSSSSLPGFFGFGFPRSGSELGPPSIGSEDEIEDSRGGAWRDSLIDHDSSGAAEKENDPLSRLRGMGIEIFDRSRNSDLSWDTLAGYDRVKSDMEETVVNALKYPDIYDKIAKKTRVVFESNRPKAILLEGPPGTGKTLTARILASRCERPLVHLKLEHFVSKWYGDSEKKLSKIFDACDELDGAIIFIDEVDSVAGSRDNNNMHEATRRILSVVLQRIEGFDGKGKSLLICATNRKSDLDPALVSRFDLSVHFELPDSDTRAKVIARYAKQFAGNNNARDKKALDVLASASAGLSCRDIKESCEHAERKLASKLIRKEKGAGEVPDVQDYLSCLEYRKTVQEAHSNCSEADGSVRT